MDELYRFLEKHIGRDGAEIIYGIRVLMFVCALFAAFALARGI